MRITRQCELNVVKDGEILNFNDKLKSNFCTSLFENIFNSATKDLNDLNFQSKF